MNCGFTILVVIVNIIGFYLPLNPNSVIGLIVLGGLGLFLVYIMFEKMNEKEHSIPDFIETVYKAKEEWEEARIFFNEVIDPMLIDHAIYRLESTEKKYAYLLKLAAQENIVNRQIALR